MQEAESLALDSIWADFVSGIGRSNGGVPVHVLDSGQFDQKPGCVFPLDDGQQCCRDVPGWSWSKAVAACLKKEITGYYAASSILRWDLPTALFSFTLRESASPIGWVFDDVPAVRGEQSSCFIMLDTIRCSNQRNSLAGHI